MRSGLLEAVVALVGFAGLTIALTAPLAPRLGAVAYRIDNGDGQFSVWNTAWVARSLLVDPRRVFDANIFYPEKGALAFSEANLGSGVVAAPLYWATGNPYAAHGFVVLLSFLVSALGAYALIRYLTRDRVAATCAGIAYGFCPHVFAHLLHIQLLWTGGLPWGLLAFHRLADRPSARRGAVLGLAMSVQLYFCAYYAVFLALTVGLFAVVVVGTRRRLAHRPYAQALGVAAVVALATSWPLVWQYLEFQQATGFVRPLSASDGFSADWQAYLASAAYAHSWMLPALGRWNEVLFPGFVATAFALAAVCSWRRVSDPAREATMLYGLAGALAFWASLGPSAGLYRALYATVPPLSFMRAPSRFGIVVVLAVVALAGIGIAEARRRWRWTPAWASLVLVAAMVGEHVVPLEFRPVPPPDPAYLELARLPDGAVIEMPVYSERFQFARARYMQASTIHWKPLVNGYSDYIPSRFQERLETLGDFPSEESFRVLGQDGVRYAVFHLDAYGPLRAELDERLARFAPYMTLRYGDEKTKVFELTGGADCCRLTRLPTGDNHVVE